MPKKKIIKKTNARKPVKVAPVAEMHTCACGDACKCGCSCGKFKKFVVLFIVFLLGFAVAKLTCCRGGHDMYKKRAQERHPVFVNGCLDMESIMNRKMRKALQDTPAISDDDCITIDEYKSVRATLKK
jgi:hypothetical protein